jgi:hypothetical protein
LHSPRQSAPKRSWRSKAGTFIIACVGNDNDLREVVPEEGRCSFTGVPRTLAPASPVAAAGGLPCIVSSGWVGDLRVPRRSRHADTSAFEGSFDLFTNDKVMILERSSTCRHPGQFNSWLVAVATGFGVSNFAQTPSRRASRNYWKNLLRSNFKVTQVQQISSVRQKFGYFGMIAAILIVTAALCWGLDHI